MRILAINTFNIFSTGTIMIDILKYAEANGNSIRCLYGRTKNDSFGKYVGTNVIVNKLSNSLVYLTGLIGHFHIFETKKMIKAIKEFNPDIIHIHNLHGNYCNLNLLMKYIYKNNIPLVMTAQDFWYATGRCAHHLSCEKWMSGCGGCDNLHRYMHSLFIDRSKKLLKEKKKWYSAIKPTLVCSSKWVFDEFKKSFVGDDLDLKLIYNGVDDTIFNIQNRIKNGKIKILGVASQWTNFKGLDTFNRLAKDLPEDKFEISLVGLTDKDNTDSRIIRIAKTTDKQKLSNYYNNADVFVNPTMVDTFPTTNIESMLCGVPVIVYDVCGAAEAIDEYSGIKIPSNNYSMLLSAIKSFRRNQFQQEKVRLHGQKFSKNNYLSQYLSLYEEVFNNR